MTYILIALVIVVICAIVSDTNMEGLSSRMKEAKINGHWFIVILGVLLGLYSLFDGKIFLGIVGFISAFAYSRYIKNLKKILKNKKINLNE